MTRKAVAEMLADLEARIAFHREQEAVHERQETFHAEQMTLHREQRARHAAAREQTAQHLAALRAAADNAEAILQETPATATPDREEAEAPAPRLLSRMIALAVQDRPAGRFGATQVAAEVNRRFAGALEKPVSTETVGKNLHRLVRAGVIRTVRKGVSHKEALFEKVPSP